jgi:hypothetical protein
MLMTLPDCMLIASLIAGEPAPSAGTMADDALGAPHSNGAPDSEQRLGQSRPISSDLG